MAGGGVRGVITYVSRFDPNSKSISKTVFLMVDLSGIVLAAHDGIARLKSE